MEGMMNLRGNGEWGAVLCHPHPLYGGTMEDGVLAVLDGALAGSDVTTLRFNFRGVGDSKGAFDDGRGEAEDVISAVNWLTTNQPVDRLILCGYSFGAVMALRAVAKLPTCDAVILVAPPVQMMRRPPPFDGPMLVILGEEDNIVDATEVARFFAPRGAIETLPGTDHFFFGASQAILRSVGAFMKSL